MARFIPVTQQQYLVTLSGIDTYWEKFSGLSDQASTSEYSDGFERRTFKLIGPRSVQDFTLEKAYDPVTDAPIIALWQDFRIERASSTADAGLTVSIRTVEYVQEAREFGPTTYLYGVKLISLQYAQADKTSQQPSMLTLGACCDRWAST